MATTPKINYLSNKELLIEIHKSKLTYCSFVNPEYQNEKYKYYDIIVNSLDEIDDEVIEYSRMVRANRIYKQKRDELLEMGFRPLEIKLEVNPSKVKTEDIVFRVMCNDHIPKDKLKKRKKNADGEEGEEEILKVTFPPFKHYIIKDGKPIEVLRSHSKDGQFCNTHGKITNRLAFMFMKLVDRYGQRGNFRSYTYNDEMRGQALVQLSQVGLQFDESRSSTPNPFAYYTAVINASFTRILNIEKKNQNIRDDVRESLGHNPSYSRQIDHEYKVRESEKNYRDEV